MKRNLNLLLIITITALLTGAGTSVFFLFHKGHGDDEVATHAEKRMYHCPMHPNYISDKPGSCPICGMTLVPVNSNEHGSDGEKTQGGKRKIMYYRDAMKPWITSDKPGKASDGMDLVPVYEGDSDDNGTGIKIDPTTIQNMGVTTAPVVMRSLHKEIRTSATLENNETGVHIVNTKIMGYVEKLYIDFTGQPVRKGQPLLSIYSPDLVSTQEEYLQALRYSKGLSGSSQIAQGGAEALVESAKRRLQNWDISESQIQSLAERGTPQKTMTIFSPANGVVLEKMVVTGQSIDAGMPLYKIANLSTIWAMANVYQDDLPYVKKGMKAEIEISSIPGKKFEGTVQFISPVLDMNSKTAQVRIEIPNTADFQLKPQMFAEVNVLSPVVEHGTAIPEQAVIHSGTRNVVIVSLGNGYFKPVEVKVGMTADGYIQIIDGLQEGQTIVTSSQFLIDSESNLRAAVSKMSGPDSSENSPENRTPEQDHKGHSMPGMGMNGKTVDNVASTPASMDAGAENNTLSIDDQKDKKETSTSTVEKGKVIYICPMDKDVVSDKPGKCPKCGMNLVKTE